MNLKKIFLFTICIDSSLLSSTQRIIEYTNFNGDFNLQNCFFYRTTTFNGEGGIIYILNINCNLNIKLSTFSQIISSNNGGVIYFSCGNTISSFEIEKSCVNECWCTGASMDGNFGYIIVNNLKNSYYLLSITKSASNGKGDSPIRIQNGYQNLNSINHSLNFCEYIPGFWNINPIEFKCLFSTFSNDKSLNWGIIYMNMNIQNAFFSNINLIYSYTPSYGIFYLIGNGVCLINNSILYQNKGLLFQTSSTSTLNIQNSIINHTSTLISGNVNTYNNLNNFYNTFILKHFSSFLCHADNIENITFKKLSFLKLFKLFTFIINSF